MCPINLFYRLIQHRNISFVKEVLVRDKSLIFRQWRKLLPQYVLVLKLAKLTYWYANDSSCEALSECIYGCQRFLWITYHYNCSWVYLCLSEILFLRKGRYMLWNGDFYLIITRVDIERGNVPKRWTNINLTCCNLVRTAASRAYKFFAKESSCS